MSQRTLSLRSQFLLFLLAIACMSTATSIHDSIFNNFLSDIFHFEAGARGWLELPRELPGFLVVVTTGLLAALPINRVGAIAAATFMLGMIGMATVGRELGPMVVAMMIASTGLHLLQPVTTSIAVATGHAKSRGKRIGLTGALETCGVVLGTGFVWFFFSQTNPQYTLGFTLAAIGGALTTIIYLSIRLQHMDQPRAKMVFHKKFSLYYVLEFLFGARKQIFLTFGPWVLIKIYDQPANSIASLLMIGALIGIVFKPLAGMAIDRLGSRNVLIFDALALIFVCLGYGYALKIAEPKTAKLIAEICFIGDNLLFALGSARAVYVSHLTESHQELTSTLAMGVSINHIVSMLIPAVAGIVWVTFGYERVFLSAAILSIIVAGVASFIPSHKKMFEEKIKPA
jgi:MFS family permease